MDDQFALSANAARSLPVKPLRGTGADLLLYDVVLALDIAPPRRHAQDYFWLETMASSPQDALQLARVWVEQSSDKPFEITGMIRSGSRRLPRLGNLRVNWSLPVERRAAPGAVVRHPITGLRIGFVATAAQEDRYLPEEASGEYRLLVHKPTENGRPVCLAPLVELIDWPQHRS